MKQIKLSLFSFFLFYFFICVGCNNSAEKTADAPQDSSKRIPDSVSKNKVGTFSQLQYLDLLQPEYRLREELASTELKQRLEQERQIIKTKGLNFTVANTSVSELKIKDITGAFPISKIISDSIVKLMRAKLSRLLPKVKKSTLNVNPLDNAYDPRLKNLTPLIRFQKCGNCWAYSAIATLEFSYIRIHQLNPNSIDLSEKQMVACSKAGDCYGGWPYLVFSYLFHSKDVKILIEDKCKDDSTNIPCPSKDPTAKVSLTDWGIVDISAGLNKIAEKSKIKECIAKYGAVSACVLATPTFQDFGSTIDGRGVFHDQPSDNSNPEINHAIVIIGWDDDKQAWLIRNSWGIGWGNKGYAWIDYNTNNIGYSAIWALAN